MKKEMTMSVGLIDRIRMFVQSVGEGLASVYSAVMEEEISVAQSWKILNASASLVVTVFFPASVPVRLVLVGWFAYAVWDCMRAGLR